MRVPMILVLNMMDVVKQRGIEIDCEYLSQQFACPVIPITATMRNGLESLQAVIDQAVADSPIPRLKIEYDPALEVAIANLTPLLDKQAQNQGCDLRWLAVRLLEDDTLAIKIAGKGVADQVKKLQLAIEHETDDEIDILAADARYTFVNKLTQGSVCRLNEVSQLTSDKIDRIV